MTTYDLNRLWLTIANEDAATALRQTDAARISVALAAKSDFSAPASRGANAQAEIVEVP